MTPESGPLPESGPFPEGRPLSEFTVELDVYSGPYEWLLALILKDEVEIFEVPLKELIDLYLSSRDTAATNALERDAEFASSASSLVLLKSRTLLPLFEPEPGEEDEPIEPEELAGRLALYLRVKRGAEVLRVRLEENSGHLTTGHELRPRPGWLKLDRRKLDLAARRLFSRLEEPTVSHLGEITVTVQELAALIRTSLGGSGPVSFEEITREMDRLHVAVAFAAALSLANEGAVSLSQSEPLGPLTLELLT
ncbi:segregation and condensation protein A [Rubrobacter indicoceani]|uniref:segregation and condensation protein A n=1 Tax=Rubrobacter indicoceani TaxID=2051957 RepID=UPI000E5A5FBB|nr:ScpA family protein [Rubrobacter indicoceani]